MLKITVGDVMTHVEYELSGTTLRYVSDYGCVGDVLSGLKLSEKWPVSRIERECEKKWMQGCDEEYRNNPENNVNVFVRP